MRRVLRSRAHLRAVALVVTLGALWSAAPARAATAIFGGTTSKNRATLEPIVVRADPANMSVKSVVLAWEADCSDQTILPYSDALIVSTMTPGFGLPDAALVISSASNGDFSGSSEHKGTLTDGSTVSSTTKLDGHLGARSASGSLSVQATIQPASGGPAITCTTGDLQWSASRGRGTVYGGSTSQAEPVVLRVNPRRTRVTDLIFGWESRCTPSGSFRFGDWLSNFPLRAGVFKAKFNQSFRRDDGNSLYSYNVRGRVGRIGAQGSISVDWNRTFDDGSPSRTCSTGRVAWRATTG